MTASSHGFQPFTLNNGGTVVFPTNAGGVLSLGPGPLRLDACITERYRAEYWYGVLDCQLLIADAEGQIWQATASFLSPWLLYPLIDLSRKEPGRWLHHAPAAWNRALTKRALIRGVEATYDDRFYRYVWIDNTGFCFQFKYFGGVFEIAALTPDRIVVSVANLFASWNPLLTAGPDGSPLPLPPPTEAEPEEEDEPPGEYGDFDNAEPLAYEIDAGRLLFRNTASKDEEKEWCELDVSRPLVFERGPGKGKAQGSVVFLPGQQPRASVGAESGDETGFIEIPWDCRWAQREFLTDAGGRLLLKGNLPARFRLDRHPDSGTQPIDVLRSRVRLVDEAGDLWESVSLFTPEFFFENLVNLDDISILSYLPAAADWKPAAGALFGVRAFLNDGAWRHLLTCDELVAFQGKQQTPTVDVNPHEGKFVVCITGLRGRRRPVEISHEDRFLTLDPKERASELNRWEEDQPLPPLHFEVSFTALAFRNTTVTVAGGFRHRNPIPIPIVFTKVGSAEPREGVRFVADPE